MKKIFNLHTFSLVLVVAIVSMFSIVKVNAEITWKSDGGCLGSSTTLTRTLTNVPSAVTNTFSYAVATSGTQDGTATGAPTIGNVSFSGTNPTNSTVSGTSTINFAGITNFSNVGYYTYSITESSSNSTLYPVDSSSGKPAKIRIWVSHEVNASNIPTDNWVACAHVLDSANNKLTTPTFTSAVPSNQYGSINLSKGVTGNYADKNKYFPITIKINTAGTYSITGLTSLTAANSCTGAAQSTTATVTGNSTNGTTICLKHGQTVTIGKNGSLDAIPINTKIDISEANDADYIESYKVNSAAAVTSNALTNHTLASGSTTVAFTNNWEETTPTGVILTILPYAILIAIAAGGIFAFMNFKKKQPVINEETL